jgi:hypothetical protein
MNTLFEYRDGDLYWKIPNYRGFHFNGKKAGYVNKGRVYVQSRLLPVKHCSVSRIVWTMFNGEIPDGMSIDHIDCDPLNNRIDNLRVVDHVTNMANTHGKCTKKSGLPKNVYKCSEKGKYRFSAMRKGVQHTKTHLSLEDAVSAANDFLLKEGIYKFVKEV